MAKYAPIKYRDLILRICLCIIAAHIMTHFDEPDSVWEAIFTDSYWRSFIASFIIAMIITSLIRYISMRLDRHFHWIYDTLIRVLLQLFFGVILPCLLTLLLVALYFAIFGKNILDTEYIKEDFIVACMMILCLNVFYFGISLYYQLRAIGKPIAAESPSGPEGTPTDSAIGTDTENLNRHPEIIIVNTPRRSIPVKVADICYIYTLDGFVFLRTFHMQGLSDSYRLDEKLKDYEEILDPVMFFRINRQMIVNINAVKDFHPYTQKTLELTLDPLPYPDKQSIPENHQRLTIVAEHRVTAFKDWIKR